MADLRIVDAPVLLQESITDDVKMPTGGLGNYAIRLGDLVWYVVAKEQLASKSYVDTLSKGVKDELDGHISDKNNPHQVTKVQVGLGNVDNTADVDKPVSNAVNSAIITATIDMATKTYVNQKDNLKADKATTLSGYGITDAYTRADVDSVVGELSNLKPTDKTNLVRAINEVYDNTKGVVALYDENVEAGVGASGWTSDLVLDTNQNLTQKQINVNTKRGIANRYDSSLTYNSGESVVLTNGDVVKSVVDGNVNDPNADMTGWIKTTNPKNINFTDIDKPSNNLFNKLRVITPYVFGAKGDRVTDDTVAIQAFWNYLATNLVETADITGDFVISADISANTGTGGVKSWKDKPTYAQNIIGHMTLRPNGYSSPNAVLQFDGFRDTDFNGKISIICPGSSNYTTRKNDVGVLFNNCSRLKSCHIEVWYVAGRAVVLSGNTSVSDIGSIDAWYCGASAAATGANNIALQTPTYVHTGTTSNTAQRTEITVAAGSIPRALQEDDFVLFFDSSNKYSEAKIIRGIDRVNNKITVFPWVYTSEESMTPYYLVGGGFYSSGGDTSAIKIGRLSSVSCGVSCNAQSLYPVSIVNHVTQYCGIGFASGASASEGGVTVNMYCEANGMNDLACSGNAKYTYISIGPLAEDWKLSHLQASATSGSNRIRGSVTSPRNIAKTGFLPLASNGQVPNGNTQSFPRISTGKATPVSLFVNMSEGGGSRGTTVYLHYDEVANREFGLDTVWVMLHSSQPSGGMSGNAIFAPESGQSYTVNGQATWSTTISKPTLFCCRLIAGDWRIFRFDGVVDGQQTLKIASITYDPPPLATAAQQSTTVTLTGAKLGDIVNVSFDKPLQGTQLWAEVTSANTVTVYHRNDTGVAVDLASGTLTVKIV